MNDVVVVLFPRFNRVYQLCATNNIYYLHHIHRLDSLKEIFVTCLNNIEFYLFKSIEPNIKKYISDFYQEVIRQENLTKNIFKSFEIDKHYSFYYNKDRNENGKNSVYVVSKSKKETEIFLISHTTKTTAVLESSSINFNEIDQAIFINTKFFNLPTIIKEVIDNEIYIFI